MHAPDGLLTAPVAGAFAVVSAIVIAFSLRQSERDLADRQIPLAGLTAAFVFAAQMINFPVAAGTSGHLLGGTLAAVLVGPYVAAVVVTVVVIIQALMFADGGITALGYNVFNMAIVTTFGGWAVFLLVRRVALGKDAGRGRIAGATGVAAFVSVILAAAAFSIEWLFGATAPVSFDTVFAAMVGVHSLIGIGEAVISTMTVSAVLAARPDLVYGARGRQYRVDQASSVGWRPFAISAAALTVVIAGVASQFASSSPDGLDTVSATHGMRPTGARVLDHAVFSQYAVGGIHSPTASIAVAGVAGVAITGLIAFGMLLARRSS